MAFISDLNETTFAQLIVLPTSARLVEAAKILADTARQMIVIENEEKQMAGVVTRADVVRMISSCSGSSCSTACAHVMTTKVHACKPTHELHAVWEIMRQKRLQSMPIVDDGNYPVGLVLARNVLEKLLTETEHEDQLMKDYVMGIGYR